MSAISQKTFICAHCGGIFTTDRSDEDALAETAHNFPTEVAEDCELAVLCDECYQQFMKWVQRAKGK